MKMAEPQLSSHLTAAERDQLKQNMIKKLAHTNAHFKHQQIGEPDLGVEEKCDIASRLLDRSEVLFLERFSKYLTLEDVAYFSDSKDYQIQFYLNAVKENLNSDKSLKVIKNRRYQALQQMMNQGDYFSDEEMQRRDPLLFEQMIGQYETDEEKQAREVDKSDMRFSSILLKYMDIQETKETYDKMKEREEEQEEETDDETESEDESENEGGDGDESNSINNTDENSEAAMKISASEQSQLRGEFLQIMQERFLSGEDKQFDYSKVDLNSDYDSLAILNQDAEDKYFDHEDSPNLSQDMATDSGE